jgi:hypothetical protein
MYDLLLSALRTLNQFLTAGIAITAFSLLLYAFSFNLRDRVARSFAIILVCVVVVFVGEAMASVSNTPQQTRFWLTVEWPGIIFLPAAYLHFSDALLTITGRPSRGRRYVAVRLSYLISFGFCLSLPWLVGQYFQQPYPHLDRTWLTWLFTGFYGAVMAFSWYNFYRAYQRTVTSASRRRMRYLITGALAPALGSFPYLIFGSAIAQIHPLLFLLLATFANLLISILLVLMAYAVAFFGVPWPDRVVKRRLFKWLMRGPFTASVTLVLVTLTRRAGVYFGMDFSALAPFVMIATILIIEHLITLAAPVWERWLFYGRDRADVELLQTIEERLLTSSDLRQFLESILAAVCDRLQSSSAFVAVLGQQGLDMLVSIGSENQLKIEDLSADLLETVTQNGIDDLFSWGDYWLSPLLARENGHDLLGLLGVIHLPGQSLDEDQSEALAILTERAELALMDRRRQQQVFSTLEALTPQVEMIQRLRAAARYDGSVVLSRSGAPLEDKTVSQWVKDALTHYWGGPKLTESPLLELEVVQKSIKDNEETPVNALRAILRQAIDHIRPEGERRFTGEWILFNILEMKFLEGRKVRDIAIRLAMSEADLYRKQRVAIEAVAKAIMEMENDALLQTRQANPIGAEVER